MNFLRWLLVAMLFVVAHVNAMDNSNQDGVDKVFCEGGSNTQLQMGKYFGTTHPEVVTWLRKMYFNQPMPSRILRGPNGCLDRSVKLAPDGKTILSNDGMHIWNFKSHGSDGFVSVSHDGTISLRDFEGGRYKILDGHLTTGLYSAYRSPNSEFISNFPSAHDNFCIWDVASGACKEFPDTALKFENIWKIPFEGHIIISSDWCIAWDLEGKSVALRNIYGLVMIWNIPNMRLFNMTIDCLSLVQQNFIISLFHISQRYHRPLVILPETGTYATFETLPPCLRQLFLQNNCVRLNFSFIEQPRQAILRFVQNHGLALAGAACVLLGAYLS